MSAQSFLARLGLRLGTLGTAASLAIAAPVGEGQVGVDAHTHAARTGWFFPTGDSMGLVANGAERVRLFSDGGVQVGGTYTASPGSGVLKVTDGIVQMVSVGTVYVDGNRVNVGISNNANYGCVTFGRSNLCGAASQSVVLGIGNVSPGDGSILVGVNNTCLNGGFQAYTALFGISLIASGPNRVELGIGNANKFTILSTGELIAGTLGVVGAPTYTFTGDTNTGIYSPAANTLGLVTDGAERVRVYNDGGLRVGGTYTYSPGSGSIQTNADSYFNDVRVGRGLGDFNTNTTVGWQSLITNTTGGSNTAVGYLALSLNQSGSYNTAVGTASLSSNTSASNNAAFGWRALRDNVNGGSNTAAGSAALRDNISGSSNSALGNSALQANTGGHNNCAVGVGALASNTTGSSNSVIGTSAMQVNTTGANNVAIGFNAGRYFGVSATACLTSSYSTFLGYDTRAAADGETNQTVIGYNAIGNGSNTVTIGNTSVIATYLRGAVVLPTMALPTPATGMVVIDSGDGNKLKWYNGTAWQTAGGTSGGGSPGGVITNIQINDGSGGFAGSDDLRWVSGLLTSAGASANLRLQNSSDAARVLFGNPSVTRWSLGSVATSVNFTLALSDVGGSPVDTPITVAGTSGGVMTLARPVAITGSLRAGASVELPIASVSANTTLDATHYTLLVDATSGSITITLPDSSASNVDKRIYNVKKIDSSANTVTVTRAGTDQIDGANTSVLASQYQCRTFHCRAAAAAANRWSVI